MGRQSIQLDSQLLKELRTDKALTQLALANAVSKLSGTRDVRSDETRRNDYQRIERTGRTSPKTAEALSIVLGVSVAHLQGKEQPEVIDYQKRIEELLTKQLESDDNEALHVALKKVKEEHSDNALSSLAHDIARRIETVQLGRNPAEIAELVELTGLTESELLKPANVYGHWFVTVSSRISIYPRCDIVRGTPGVMNQIHELVDKYLEGGVSDSSIRLWCDGIWYRMEVQIPRIDELIRIDMVRCLPDDKGLRWIGPSWHDSWIIKDWLHDWAWSSANFVEFFDVPMVPSKVSKLRFLIKEYAGSFSAEVGQTVIDGNLEEIPQELMDSVTADGRSHGLVLNWLSVALGEHFERIFSEYPALCWGFLQSRGVEILFFPPMNALHLPSGLRYEISLVQENEPGNYVEAPLRRSEREALEQRLKKLLT